METEEERREGTTFAMDVPRRTPWSPFDGQCREGFCRLLARGASRSKATRLLGLNASTVSNWIALGRRSDADWRALGREPDDLDHVVRYREFYRDVLKAEAAADAIVETVLVDAALGREELVHRDDGATDIVRVGADWRAADALGKRRERMAMFDDLKRLRRAQADEAEANARFARARAQRAEEAINSATGALVFPDKFLRGCSAEERVVLENAMVRQGLRVATDTDVDAAIAALPDDYCDDIERFAKRWRTGLPVDTD